MQEHQTFDAKRIYASDRGLHIEFNSENEAIAFCRDGMSRGITNYDLVGNTVIKKFLKSPQS
jgi:hypothetical protein